MPVIFKGILTIYNSRFVLKKAICLETLANNLLKCENHDIKIEKKVRRQKITSACCGHQEIDVLMSEMTFGSAVTPDF